MTIKDKLAAALINHWYVIDRSVALKRVKRLLPAKERYDGLEAIASKSDADITTVINEIHDHTLKNLTANIAHIIETESQLSELTVEPIAALKMRSTVSAKIIIPKDLGLELVALRNALQCKDQSTVVLDLLKHLPQIQLGDTNASITVNMQTALKPTASIIDAEKLFLTQWNAIKVLILSLHRGVFSAVSAIDKSFILDKKVNIIFANAAIDNGIFSANKFSLAETPESRSDREIKERLDRALKRRIKKITSARLSDDNIEYLLDDTELPSIKIALEVATQW